MASLAPAPVSEASEGEVVHTKKILEEWEKVSGHVDKRVAEHAEPGQFITWFQALCPAPNQRLGEEVSIAMDGSFPDNFDRRACCLVRCCDSLTSDFPAENIMMLPFPSVCDNRW